MRSDIATASRTGVLHLNKLILSYDYLVSDATFAWQKSGKREETFTVPRIAVSFVRSIAPDTYGEAWTTVIEAPTLFWHVDMIFRRP
jgi:hypothetical protein